MLSYLLLVVVAAILFVLFLLGCSLKGKIERKEFRAPSKKAYLIILGACSLSVSGYYIYKAIEHSNLDYPEIHKGDYVAIRTRSGDARWQDDSDFANRPEYFFVKWEGETKTTISVTQKNHKNPKSPDLFLLIPKKEITGIRKHIKNK